MDASSEADRSERTPITRVPALASACARCPPRGAVLCPSAESDRPTPRASAIGWQARPALRYRSDEGHRSRHSAAARFGASPPRGGLRDAVRTAAAGRWIRSFGIGRRRRRGHTRPGSPARCGGVGLVDLSGSVGRRRSVEWSEGHRGSPSLAHDDSAGSSTRSVSSSCTERLAVHRPGCNGVGRRLCVRDGSDAIVVDLRVPGGRDCTN